jgi:hypothetical protein
MPDGTTHEVDVAGRSRSVTDLEVPLACRSANSAERTVREKYRKLLI